MRDNDSLLVSSWDGTLSLHDTKLDTIAWKQTLRDEVPILDAKFVGANENAAISGSLDGKVRLHSLDIAGSNPKAVREMDRKSEFKKNQ